MASPKYFPIGMFPANYPTNQQYYNAPSGGAIANTMNTVQAYAPIEGLFSKAGGFNNQGFSFPRIYQNEPSIMYQAGHVLANTPVYNSTANAPRTWEQYLNR